MYCGGFGMFGAAGPWESVVTDADSPGALGSVTPAATATTSYENVVAFVPVCSTAEVPVVGLPTG